MANSSILGGDHAPIHPRGTDLDALGPSDSSDSGSDVQVDRGRTAMPDEGSEGSLAVAHASSSDSAGTGERAAADGRDVEAGADILPDRIGISPSDAMDAAVSIDDPDSAEVQELAASDDEEDDENLTGDV